SSRKSTRPSSRPITSKCLPRNSSTSSANGRRRSKSENAPTRPTTTHKFEPMNESQPVIEIKGLSYAYGRGEAVHGLDLAVRPGCCYGLFGRNGAGKTTTMKCLLNLLRPRAGTVRLFGLDPARNEV